MPDSLSDAQKLATIKYLGAFLAPTGALALIVGALIAWFVKDVAHATAESNAVKEMSREIITTTVAINKSSDQVKILVAKSQEDAALIAKLKSEAEAASAAAKASNERAAAAEASANTMLKEVVSTKDELAKAIGASGKLDVDAISKVLDGRIVQVEQRVQALSRELDAQKARTRHISSDDKSTHLKGGLYIEDDDSKARLQLWSMGNGAVQSWDKNGRPNQFEVLRLKR